MWRRNREKEQKADNQPVQPNDSIIDSLSVASRLNSFEGAFGMQVYYLDAAIAQTGRKFRERLRMMSPHYYIR
jgi:hypothetical protein